MPARASPWASRARRPSRPVASSAPRPARTASTSARRWSALTPAPRATPAASRATSPTSRLDATSEKGHLRQRAVPMPGGRLPRQRHDREWLPLRHGRIDRPDLRQRYRVLLHPQLAARPDGSTVINGTCKPIPAICEMGGNPTSTCTCLKQASGTVQGPHPVGRVFSKPWESRGTSLLSARLPPYRYLRPGPRVSCQVFPKITDPLDGRDLLGVCPQIYRARPPGLCQA